MGSKILEDIVAKAVAVNRFFSPFWYTVPVVASLAPANSSTPTITFDQDSSFYWTGTSYFVDLAGAAITDSARPIPLITVQLTDTGSGRLLLAQASPIDTVASYKGADLYELVIPRQFDPNSTLRISYTNYSAATTYTNLYMVLHGIKVYK